jgi:hypothetical protein
MGQPSFLELDRPGHAGHDAKHGTVLAPKKTQELVQIQLEHSGHQIGAVGGRLMVLQCGGDLRPFRIAAVKYKALPSSRRRQRTT